MESVPQLKRGRPPSDQLLSFRGLSRTHALGQRCTEYACQKFSTLHRQRSSTEVYQNALLPYALINEAHAATAKRFDAGRDAPQ
jgi:hypothetical protein